MKYFATTVQPLEASSLWQVLSCPFSLVDRMRSALPCQAPLATIEDVAVLYRSAIKSIPSMKIPRKPRAAKIVVKRKQK